MGPEPARTASEPTLPSTSPSMSLCSAPSRSPPPSRLQMEYKGVAEVVINKCHAHNELSAHAERKLLVAECNAQVSLHRTPFMIGAAPRGCQSCMSLLLGQKYRPAQCTWSA